MFVAGFTNGNLSATKIGYSDAVLAKYDANGSLQWTKQFGSNSENVVDCAIDKQGNLYMVGSAYVEDSLNARSDALLIKFDNEGEVIWNRQIAFNRYNDGLAVGVDILGNILISGSSTPDLNAGVSDAFIAMYDAGGNQKWSGQLATPSHEFATGVSSDDSGNVYITGWTSGSLAGQNHGSGDAFVSKFSLTGDLLWIRQFGTDNLDIAEDVVADGAGNVYVTGDTGGSLAAPIKGVSYFRGDAFVAKYDTLGNSVWTKQLGSDKRDIPSSISLDTSGNIYVAGFTEGAFGKASYGDFDAFAMKLDNSGAPLWIQNIGSNLDDKGFGMEIDGHGGIYITGDTTGAFGGPPQSESYYADLFVVKLTEALPEPGCIQLLLVVLAATLSRRVAPRK